MDHLLKKNDSLIIELKANVTKIGILMEKHKWRLRRRIFCRSICLTKIEGEMLDRCNLEKQLNKGSACNRQCDQIGRFFRMILAINFRTKVAQLFGDFWCNFKKHHFRIKLPRQHFDTFGLIFILTSGHTGLTEGEKEWGRRKTDEGL